MENIAIILLNSDSVKMQFVHVNKNKSFAPYKSISMPVNLTKDFYGDYFFKPAIIKDVVLVMKVYKQMIDAEEIKTTLCYATCLLNDAKNNNGVLNEIQNVTGFNFNVITPEDEVNYIYTAVINTFNKPKSLIVNINSFNTTFILYNRRNILETKYIPVGYETLYNKFFKQGISSEDFCAQIKDFYKEEIKNLDFANNLPEEFEVIGTGNMFNNLGLLSRRAKKYPVDLAHNYPVNKADFQKVYGVLKTQELGKFVKIKQVSVEDSKYLLTAFAMIDTIWDYNNKDTFVVSRTGFMEGVALSYAIPLTVEKPISDTLGYSLQTINEYYDNACPVAVHNYNLSMILFKQLKVLHKLGRTYVRVLRIASYLYNSGMRVNYHDKEKIAFNIILNSEIYGVSHAEIVMASFVAELCEFDNFSLVEWVRYKDLLTDEDLQAVRKLAVILKIADGLNITGFGNVVDVNCDILGDSVIMKTIVNDDASLEIKYAGLVASEFKKCFNKNLEII